MIVIYRISDARKGTHLDGVNKVDCLISFRRAFGTQDVIIVADNCDKNTISAINWLGYSNVIQTKLGNCGSFANCLCLALQYSDDEIIYFCEDDYLHHPESKRILIEGVSLGTFVTLYDHSDKYCQAGPNPYVLDGGENTRVVIGESCHWKVTNSTTMTFAAKVRDLRATYKTMLKYLTSQKTPDDFHMWLELAKYGHLISAIPGYATHCHEPWISPFFNLKLS